MKCKFNGKKIRPFMSFGKMPIANGFLKKNDFKKEFFYNLEVGFSENIGLLQIANHPKPKQMFHKNYPFYTSSSRAMVEHFKSYSDWCKKFLKHKSKIIEIGSNDGTFLSNFSKKKFDTVGFEPSKNVSDFAKKRGIRSINKFFNTKTISQIKSFHKNTDLICAANVICHIPDIKDVFKSVKTLLSNDGLFIFEEPYLGSVFDKTSFDQIYDEHIFIFSAFSIKRMSSICGLKLIDLIPQKTHGGSMRYVLVKKNSKRRVSERVERIIKKEKIKNLHTIKSCITFKKKFALIKKDLKKKLTDLKNKNKKICGYAATSKSTTILNYCEIGPDLIEYICDTTPEKIGKYSPGMHIPIKSHEMFMKDRPDITILFAWNHKKEIVKKEKNYKKKSGKWLTFFPKVKIW